MGAGDKERHKKYTLKDMNDFRLELTGNVERIQRAVGTSYVHSIYERLDDLENLVLKDEQSYEDSKRITSFMESVRSVAKYGSTGSNTSDVWSRFDLFEDYEEQIEKTRDVLNELSNKKGERQTVLYDSLNTAYFEIVSDLSELIKKKKGKIEGGIIHIKDDEKFFDRKTEEGITIIIRLKTKKRGVK